MDEDVVDLTGLRINESRFRRHFEALARIGATNEGGIHRPTFSHAHGQARSWFKQRVLQAGLEFNIDGATNHSAVLRQPNAERTLLMGSHLDSVPNGGKYDGALGVLAALEVLLTIKEEGLSLPTHLEAIDFTDEESTYLEFLGSRAFTGELVAEEVHTFQEILEGFDAILPPQHLSTQSLLGCKRDPDDYVGYLELHIEQGSTLTEHHSQIGIVSSIVGLYSLRVTFLGRADHAGTTPMISRKNAGLGASGFNVAVDRMVKEEFPHCVATTGKMSFIPGALNVVPAQVDVFIEYRAPTKTLAKDLGRAIRAVATAEAKRFGLGLEIVPTGETRPTELNPKLQKLISKSAQTLCLSSRFMASGAGHDAQILAHFTPSAMIFVPSINGVSHSPKEFTKWEDCLHGANVLLLSALRWAFKSK